MKPRLQFSLRSLLLICIVLTVVGVVGRRVYLRFFPPPMDFLCGFDDNDTITGWHLKRLLEREGVRYEYRHTDDLPQWHHDPRHVRCGVDADDYKRVLKLLESAAKAPLPTVVLTETNWAGTWLKGDEREPFEQTYDRPLGDIIKDEPADDLIRILRAITESGGEEPSEGELKVVIHKLSGLRRWMLQADGKLAPAFEAIVEYPAERTKDRRRNVARFQKYYLHDDFRQVSVGHPGRTNYPLSADEIAADERQANLEGRLQVLVTEIGRATRASLYGGLPHRVDAEDRFVAAKEKFQTADFGGEFFYAPALVLEGAEIERLFDLVSDEKAYCPGEDKLCGGFHPDYAVEFWRRDEAVRVLVCFGCREVRILDSQGVWGADLTEAAAEKWLPILEEIGRKLPPPTPKDR